MCKWCLSDSILIYSESFQFLTLLECLSLAYDNNCPTAGNLKTEHRTFSFAYSFGYLKSDPLQGTHLSKQPWYTAVVFPPAGMTGEHLNRVNSLGLRRYCLSVEVKTSHKERLQGSSESLTMAAASPLGTFTRWETSTTKTQWAQSWASYEMSHSESGGG